MPAGPGLDLWVCLLLCDRGKVLVLSELALTHLSMGIIVGPPLGVKGSFSDRKVMWLAQGKSDKHTSSCEVVFRSLLLAGPCPPME